MILFMLAAVLMANGGGAQSSEVSCDTSELKLCVDQTPRTPLGLPRTQDELDLLCLAYQTGISCMDTWVDRCLVNPRNIAGALTLVRFLCTNDTTLRRYFLKELSCWTLVSLDWSACVEELNLAVQDISERSSHIACFNKTNELCCVRDAFLSCVAHAGLSCSAAAGGLLRRMAWVLTQDVAACTQQSRVYCSAPPLHFAAPLLTALSGALLYRPRI